MEDYQVIILVLALGCAVTTFITMGLVLAAVYLGYRGLRGAFAPEPEVLERRYALLTSQLPNASRDELVGKIIQQQATRAGLVGAITGLGGLVTLPIALPVDLLVSLRIQATMVNFIARAYGHVQGQTEESLVSSATMVGAYGGVQFGSKLLLEVVEKVAAKLIPLLSAPIGFVVNYAIAQAVGRAAVQVYSEEARQRVVEGVRHAGQQVGQQVAQTARAGAEAARRGAVRVTRRGKRDKP